MDAPQHLGLANTQNTLAHQLAQPQTKLQQPASGKRSSRNELTASLIPCGRAAQGPCLGLGVVVLDALTRREWVQEDYVPRPFVQGEARDMKVSCALCLAIVILSHRTCVPRWHQDHRVELVPPQYTPALQQRVLRVPCICGMNAGFHPPHRATHAPTLHKAARVRRAAAKPWDTERAGPARLPSDVSAPLPHPVV